MAISLYGNGREIHFGLQHWRSLLTLAVRHGWNPSGAEGWGSVWSLEESDRPTPQQAGSTKSACDTLASSRMDAYCPSKVLTVFEEDAAALADALERARSNVTDQGLLDLVALPGGNRPGRRVVVYGSAFYMGQPPPSKDCEALEELISLCRDGGFEIR